MSHNLDADDDALSQAALLQPEWCKYLEDISRDQELVYDCKEEPQPSKYKKRRQDSKINENYRVYHSASQPNSEFDRFYTSLPQYYELEDSDDDTLLFESRFESGNLK